MKQYRFKIDTPFGAKGERVPENNGLIKLAMNYWHAPQGCPDLLEEIPDPVERVREWLLHVMPAKDLAEHLLAAGLDVEKLTGGE
jgi:hypothetical protein